MTTEQDEKPKKANDSGTTITGVQLLVGIIFVPVVMRPDCMVSAWGAYLTPSELFKAFGNEVANKDKE